MTIPRLTSALALTALLLATPPEAAAQHRVKREGEVLAYGLAYDPDAPTADMPEALREMLRDYRSLPRYAQRTEGKAVEPLLRSVRSQYAPFNGSCPYYTYADGSTSAERCVSGCVATSLEQVLSFWRYPEALADTLHGWATEHYEVADVMPGTRIDWGNVLDDYSAGYTEEQAKAVADLTYWCGMAAGMSWTPESSGASLYTAFEPLWRTFGYGTVYYVQRALFSNPAWNRLLRNELEEGRPVCYTGHNMAMSGHAFNIDGVDGEGYYHVNWGYGGLYDGYYDLDYLNPFEQLGDPTDVGQGEGFFCNQTALFMHPEDFEIDISDTLRLDDALHGVRVDTITFRREPDTQGYVVADFAMTNTTGDSLNFTFEALTYDPRDTLAGAQADYVGLSAVNLAPHESKTWPVYCQFSEAGDRMMALATYDGTLPYEMAVSVGEGVRPKLSFGEVRHELVAYGDDLTARLTLSVRNDAEGGCAGDLVTYCLLEEGEEADQRHWEVLSLAGGEEQELSVTFRKLEDGKTYTFYVRCPWTIQQSHTFEASLSDAADAVSTPKEGQGIGEGALYDLQGRRLRQAVVGGIYVKNGKKVLMR